jgi:hypothetical protein
MYSGPAVAAVFNAQRRITKRRFHYGRPYRRRELPIVDRPLCLGETPAPFASRSPGVTTLGPSCTPGRQLGYPSETPPEHNWFAPVITNRRNRQRAQRRFTETVPWAQVHSLRCNPGRQLGHVLRPFDEVLARTSVSG